MAHEVIDRDCDVVDNDSMESPGPRQGLIGGAAPPASLNTRSLRATVRNPLLLLPAAQKLADLPPETQAALRDLLIELRNECRVRAEKSWRLNKGPLACYWKAAGVYCNHTSRLLKGGQG